MTDTDIVPADAISAIQKHDDSEFDIIQADSISYLPRLQVGGGNSAAVQEGKLPIAHYGFFMGDAVTDLGEVVDALVLAWQPKAMDTGGEVVVTVIDRNSETFHIIQEKSATPDSGCMWGTEWLLYLPEQEAFVTFFLASKSARRVAPDLKALLGGAATLKIKLVSNKKYKWHVPVILPCSGVYEAPPMGAIKVAAEKFSKIPDGDIEIVAEEENRPR